jgi:hypothetical protein
MLRLQVFAALVIGAAIGGIGVLAIDDSDARESEFLLNRALADNRKLIACLNETTVNLNRMSDLVEFGSTARSVPAHACQ